VKKFLIVVCAFFLIIEGSWAAGEKEIVGAIANVKIEEGNIDLVGRVDTGAKTTSINADNISVSNGFVSYTVINALGKKSTIKSKIVSELEVKNAESKEKRFFVNLTIHYRERAKKTLVNLNDRSESTYKILLGRNWLSGSYLVDVDQ